MADFDAPLLDHDADGIRELDNDLPRWWVWLFYLTIVWAVLYMLFYHVFGIGYSSAEEYKKEMNPAYVRMPSREAKLLGILPEYHSPFYDPAVDMRLLNKDTGAMPAYVEETRESDTTDYVAATDDATLAQGQGIFVAKCATCHGNYGEGGIGPNLTDDYWLHGNSFNDVYRTIKFGVPAKGMISWRMEMPPDQIQAVASFVMTLHGTNPPNPKAPQGELVEQ